MKKAVFGILQIKFVLLFFVLNTVVMVYPAVAGESENPVFLYFADPETGYLTGAPGQIEPKGNEPAFCREIVRALISGPDNELVPTLPSETSLRALYYAPGGQVFVDLSAEFVENHPGGVRSELLSVYSIVNTIILNCDNANAVKILVGGNEKETLAGHIDITRPLKARMLLVR